MALKSPVVQPMRHLNVLIAARRHADFNVQNSRSVNVSLCLVCWWSERMCVCSGSQVMDRFLLKVSVKVINCRVDMIGLLEWELSIARG